jgi:hypothetical protein
MTARQQVRQAFDKSALIEQITRVHAQRSKALAKRKADLERERKGIPLVLANMLTEIAGKLRNRSWVVEREYGQVIVRPRNMMPRADRWGLDRDRKRVCLTIYGLDKETIDKFLADDSLLKDMKMGDLDRIVEWIKGFKRETVNLSPYELDQLCSGNPLYGR